MSWNPIAAPESPWVKRTKYFIVPESSIPVACRLRVRYAQNGRIDDLRSLTRFVGDGRPEPVAVRDRRAYLVLPGYGDAPEAWFESRAENLVLRLGDATHGPRDLPA